MEVKMIEHPLEMVLVIVTVSKIIHLHFEHKTIKALIESAKTSNQRLDSLEKELRDKNS